MTTALKSEKPFAQHNGAVPDYPPVNYHASYYYYLKENEPTEAELKKFRGMGGLIWNQYLEK